MKKSKEIIGAPVIGISEGMQIGTVKGLVINPKQKNVEFLLLDEPGDDRELKGLSFRSAEGVGEFAVTVEDRNVIVNIMNIPILVELVQKGIQVLGTQVVTRRGKLLGEVVEFSVDTESGELAEFFYKGKEENEQFLPARAVITIGKEVLIVEEESELLNERSEYFSSEKEETGNFKQGDDGPAVTVEIPAFEKAEPDAAVPASVTERDLLISQPKGDPDPAEVFVQRQRQYLIGKTLLKDLKKDNGEVIAWENEIITEELFDRVYRLGTQKLMELAMSVRD